MPAHDDGAMDSGGRRPQTSKGETVGGVVKLRVKCYGDFGAGGPIAEVH
jgi:hypothetical protein